MESEKNRNTDRVGYRLPLNEQIAGVSGFDGKNQQSRREFIKKIGG